MKKRYIILTSVTLIIALALAIVLHFFLSDIHSTPTKELVQTCNIKQQQYESRTVFIISPKREKTSDTLIFYLHGGAYVAEMSKNHWNFIQSVVQDTGATVVLPDYPLTPKYNYKDVFNMIEPIYKKMIQKVESKNIIVMGDSAGGGMALALCENLQKQEIIQPNQIILISPWLDVTLQNSKIDEVQNKDKKLKKETLKIAGIAYANGNEQELKNYLISPLYGNVENLKNITIFTGTNDILNPDVHELVKKNNNIIIKEYTEKSHIWLIDEKEEAKKEYQDLIEQIQKTPIL